MSARGNVSIAMNNLGVQLLETGKYSQALAALKSALYKMTGYTAADPNNLIVAELFSKRRTVGEDSRRGIRCALEDSSFVYCHVFRIIPFSPEPRAFNFTSQETYARDAAIIMYNLAMVKHLNYMASSDHPEQSDSLSKAMYLYRTVQAIVALEENKTLRDDPYFRLVMMATCNNLGQICFSLGDFNTSSRCMADLAGLLSATPDLCNDIQLVSNEDMVGFFMNLSLMVTPTIAAAA